jgi:hypothetical protein
MRYVVGEAEIECVPEKDGLVRITLTAHNKQKAEVAMLADEIGSVVAMMLSAARTSSLANGYSLAADKRPLSEVHILPRSTIGLASRPEGLCLVLHAGAARIGLHMQADKILDLARSILAAHAPEDRPQ